MYTMLAKAVYNISEPFSFKETHLNRRYLAYYNLTKKKIKSHKQPN